MKTVAVVLTLLLAGCGSDTGDVANVCEKSVQEHCPNPWAPTPEHYWAVGK